MDAHNLAVVFAPNLMKAPPGQDLMAALADGQTELEVVKMLVLYHTYYFPDVYTPTNENWDSAKMSKSYPIPHLTEGDWQVILSRAQVQHYTPGAMILKE